MARPSKLKRFADMKVYPHVFEPDGELIRTQDYKMKGQWKSSFFKNEHPLLIELGCGRGEYTVGLAELFPQKSFIGIDIKGARMWKGATHAINQGMNNVAFVRTRIEFIQHVFAPGEVDEIWVTFPDPQPKKAQKRLIHAHFLNKYKRFLKPNGYLHLKTDSPLLHHYLKAVLQQNSIEPEVCTADLYASGMVDPLLEVKTRFEEKFLSEHKPITYIKFKMPKQVEFESPAYFDEQKWI